MTEQTLWIVIIAAIVAAALGFIAGRMSGGAKKKVSELEAEISRQKEEIAGYRDEVEAHFKKTAGLFVSMAGTYKDLFEHLSTGYERLSEGSARELFKDRVGALLIGGAASKTVADGKGAPYAAEGADQQDDIIETEAKRERGADDDNQVTDDDARGKHPAEDPDAMDEPGTTPKKAQVGEPETNPSEVVGEAESEKEVASTDSVKESTSGQETDDVKRDSAEGIPEPAEDTKVKPN